MAIELPDDLIALQQTADDEGRKIEHLDNEEKVSQRAVWFEAAAKAQAAANAFAKDAGLNRFDVEKQLRQATRHPHSEGEG
ncbi:hypothetical protein [Streptomyces sp. NPDC055243]|uniref:hypothetical protein n=1 Tax=Streptomyces sp. NPDC055243 TaxID=3365720 RepID=UPI0037CFDCFE